MRVLYATNVPEAFTAEHVSKEPFELFLLEHCDHSSHFKTEYPRNLEDSIVILHRQTNKTKEIWKRKWKNGAVRAIRARSKMAELWWTSILIHISQIHLKTIYKNSENKE